MEQKYLLKRLVGELYEIRSERRRVGSVRLITAESPNKGKYVASLANVSGPVYADTAKAALEAVVALRGEKTVANVQEAIEQRQVLLQRRIHNRPRMKQHIEDNSLLGPITSVRITPRLNMKERIKSS